MGSLLSVFTVPATVFSYGLSAAMYELSHPVASLACFVAGTAFAALVVDDIIFRNRLLGYIMAVPGELWEEKNWTQEYLDSFEKKYAQRG